ncbi:MAG: aromatic-ring-hydroxylating dioxygenase subunit beta [Betaproteobacteria bacterium]|nr:aromatic-ring-hydroxylating dioxygenase subunit beta [Betaproteobacteria bacterium]
MDETKRQAIRDLLIEYGLLLDDDKLEAWVELFTADCDYRIVTRENVEQNLPNVLIWCKGKNMLADRITSYRHVNEYNLHWDCHTISPPRIAAEADGSWRVAASYSLFQTTLEGQSRLFSVGRYRARVVFNDNAPRIREMVVVADTGSILTLLATPI